MSTRIGKEPKAEDVKGVMDILRALEEGNADGSMEALIKKLRIEGEEKTEVND